MVKDDLANTKSAWIWYVFCALGYWVLFLISSSYATNPGYLAFVAYWAGMAVLFFVRARRWKPVNERRQAAAAWGFASRVPLAAAHPLPNVGALPLPFTSTLRPAWPKFLLSLGLLGGGVLLILAAFFPFTIGGGLSPSNSFLVWLTLFALLGVSGLIALWLRPQRIEVTQEGLIVRHAAGWLHGTHQVRWSDARLFAIRGGKPGEPGTRYELSCSYAVVQWTRTRGSHWALHRPAIPFAEYDAQMDALIALISGVTGLPLYDVR